MDPTEKKLHKNLAQLLFQVKRSRKKTKKFQNNNSLENNLLISTNKEEILIIIFLLKRRITKEYIRNAKRKLQNRIIFSKTSLVTRRCQGNYKSLLDIVEWLKNSGSDK